MDTLLDFYLLGLVVLAVLIAVYGITLPERPRKTKPVTDKELIEITIKPDSDIWSG